MFFSVNCIGTFLLLQKVDFYLTVICEFLLKALKRI